MVIELWQTSPITAQRVANGDLDQEDLQRLLEKRWKRYRARQRRRKLTSSVALAAIRVADAGARLLRKAHLLKQTRREKVAVE